MLEIMGIMADRYLSSLGVDEKVLEYVVMLVTELYEYTKNHKMYI